MVLWVKGNIGTIVAALLLIAILCVVVAVIIRDKRKGRSTCGCNCAHCAMAGCCHKKK